MRSIRLVSTSSIDWTGFDAIYMFNPFDEQVLNPVVANIEKSLKGEPRKIYVLYLKALHRSVFDKSQYFKVFKQTERYVIFESR